MIELRLLGEIGVRLDDGSPADALMRQPKRLALLAYLASPAAGAWHRRDMLLALFWPELDTTHARTSLRNAIYVLRQILGDNVIINRGDEEISVSAERVHADLSDVWDALKSGRVDDALASYGGDLLPGLFPPDSEGFLRWVESERTRLKVALSTAAIARIDELEQSGSVSQALTIARQVAAINEDDETMVRRVMLLHEKMGDKAGGLSVFENYRSRLASDFDAEPAPLTVEVANRLRTSTGLMTKRMVTPPLVEPAVATDTPPRQPMMAELSRRRSMFPFVVAAVAIAVGILAFSTFNKPAAGPAIGRSTPLTTEEGLQVEPAISPNGRLVAYARGSSNSLRIFVQRIGGSAWPLTSDTSHVQLMPRWSPDNDEIMFLSQNNAYASPTLGGVPRLVAKGGAEDDDMIRSASWSPSGDSILIVRHDSLLVQVERGSTARYVGSGRQLHSCAWSPATAWIACVSGNWIAFTPGPLFGNDAPSSILLFPSDGGNPVDLTGSEFRYESPAWSRDGSVLWFTSDRDGTAGELYSARIGGDGHAIGGFARIGISASAVDASAGRVAYSVPGRRANIWSMPVPADTVVSFSTARPVTTGNQVIEVIKVSPDRKWLIYDSDIAGNADIYRMQLQGGATERLTNDPRDEFAADISSDGTTLAWHRYVKGVRRLFVKSIDSDSDREVHGIEGDEGVPRWSPDGKYFAAWSHDAERGGVFLMASDGRGGWTRRWRLPYGQLPVWSPDGSTIAFVRLDGSILTIPRDSGALKVVYAPRKNEPQATYIVWDRPETLWFMASTATAQGLWSLSLADGGAKLLVRVDDLRGRNIGPAFASDGSKFYFPVNERYSNVRWAQLNVR